MKTKLPTQTYYFVLMIGGINNVPYVIAGDDAMHEKMSSAIKEAALFSRDKRYEVLGLMQINVETGKTVQVYDAAQLHDAINEWEWENN